AFTTAVGVMVDPPPFILRQLLAAVPVDVVQFHGKEPADLVRQATTKRATKVLPADGALVESVERWTAKPPRNLAGLHVDAAGGGGQGVEADWDAVAALPADQLAKLTLAGGLNPDNVGDIVRRFRPFAVDVSSGVEGDDGRKSFENMSAFVDAVRQADAA
ncbi:MAG: phosphoribosylanthranilate isomerase, partial [Planctomycetota bacterium]